MKCAGEDAADVPSDKEEEDAVLLSHISTAAPNAKTSLSISPAPNALLTAFFGSSSCTSSMAPSTAPTLLWPMAHTAAPTIPFA